MSKCRLQKRETGVLYLTVNPFTCGAQPSSRPDMSWKCEAWTWQSQKSWDQIIRIIFSYRLQLQLWESDDVET
jgi:hypothetical protein